MSLRSVITLSGILEDRGSKVTIPSIHDADFLRETVVEVDAAVVGIGRSTWISLDQEQANEELAAAKMKEHRFDVLPIIHGAEVKRYFCTLEWNCFSSISERNITHRDVIPSQTGIRDVIKGFAVEQRHFYFLARERRINGLISIANLNCRQVKVYLFSLLSELEVSLADFIDQRVPQDELLCMGSSRNYIDAKTRYHADRAKGVEVPFVQYVYLTDLINTTIKTKLYEELGYYSGTQVRDSLGPLNELRKKVAHPARSLVTDEASVGNLWNRIDGIEEALFKLRGLTVS